MPIGFMPASHTRGPEAHPLKIATSSPPPLLSPCLIYPSVPSKKTAAAPNWRSATYALTVHLAIPQAAPGLAGPVRGMGGPAPAMMQPRPQHQVRATTARCPTSADLLLSCHPQRGFHVDFSGSSTL